MLLVVQHVGNFDFNWKTDDPRREADKNTTMTAATSAKIVADIPKHHTRQMTREFREKFELVAKVRPAIMRETYRQPTHDASSAPCETTATVDE